MVLIEPGLPARSYGGGMSKGLADFRCPVSFQQMTDMMIRSRGLISRGNYEILPSGVVDALMNRLMAV